MSTKGIRPGHRLGVPQSAETRARISASLREHWKNTDRRPGPPKGFKHSPEALRRLSEAMARRWQDPEYRAIHAQRLRAQQPAAVAASRGPKRIRPLPGTPARNLFNKIERILGAKAARQELGL